MQLGIHLPQYGRAASPEAIRAVARRAEELAPIVADLRAQRPGDDFVISYRTGWDPQGMDPAQIRDECAAYAEAGVQHVVVAPWRTDQDQWIRSMELLVDIVQPT